MTEQSEQVQQVSESAAFGLQLPPNARVKTLTFDDAQRQIHVALDGVDDEQVVPVDRIRSLYGARIRHESLTEFKSINQANAAVAFVSMATTGIPVAPKVNKHNVVVTGEELVFVFGMRIDGIDTLWYIMAASFNFRKALGPLATYSTELNAREFVKRFASFAPQAVEDSFFTAITKALPLPPPLETLIEFFRIVAR
ncbi:MAG TPA: hypothetical protein VJN22_03550 [Candidatus Eremiobacteraceae bacterium]|nr:hypothetical protein [Candidatus Eremiobacteraceae bacterium]